jgi:hypothetical protein
MAPIIHAKIPIFNIITPNIIIYDLFLDIVLFPIQYKIRYVVGIWFDLKFQITFRISDAETLSQTWLSVAGVAWLSFQA